MKNIILLIVLCFSLETLAHVEHVPGMEKTPDPARLQLAQKCFSEAVASGCRDPREDRREFRSCVRDTLESFTSGCQAFMTKKYGPVEN